MQKAIINSIILTGEEKVKNKVLIISQGKIVAIEDKIPEGVDVIDAKDKYLAPAFIDIQPNGGYELYFSKELSRAALEDMYQASSDLGAGYILPTLISSTRETIFKAIAEVENYMKEQPGILGMHLEGPFMNVKKRGAHPAHIIRNPTDEELTEIIKAGKGIIKMITIAPEIFTDKQLDMLLQSGICISIGHTTVNYEQAQYYFSKGIKLVTHLYNAMNQMGHRECGLVGATFDNDMVYAPLILDGGHCHYAAARIAYRQKREKLILLSDAAFLGRKKQKFEWDNLSIQLIDGFYRDGAGNLGGAAISMADAVRNAVEHLHVSVEEAVAMATSRVAKSIDMENQIGYIKKGYPSRFTLFDEALKDFEVITY